MPDPLHLLALDTAAFAVPFIGQISLAGYAAAIGSTITSTATGIDFVQGATASMNPGVANGLTSFGGGSGSIAGLACANLGGGRGSTKDLQTFTGGGAISSFLTLNTGTAASISFGLANISVLTRDTATNSINLRANGTINTGFDSTAGTFLPDRA